MKAFVIAVLAATAGSAHAQHGGYAGEESRDIKELNHFPGPMHLENHRRMRAVLTDEQVKRYDALRGYSSPQTEHRYRH